MPASHSLDELISRKAAEFADQVRAAAAMADKEEEIRIETEKQLAFIQKEAGIKLEGKHEFTVAKGRVDSVYTRVLIEYKNPKSPGDRIGPAKDSPGTKKVVKQIQDRFRGLKDDHGHPLNSLFGVGFDGNYFVFVRFRDGKWDVRDPVEVTRHSAEQFLWPLFNLGQKGKPFSPEYLAGDFGTQETSLAIPGVHALYDAIVATDSPKARTFFNQWKILFGEVCGYDVESPSDKMKKLAQSYGIAVKGLKPAELLFALHTYYAIFMKLLAAEIVAFFHKLPTPLKKLLQAGTSAKLKREMDELEAGSIFRHLNITNFLEGDLFAWYTAVWTEPVEKLVRNMAARVDNYNPGTLSEDPATSRDLLKKLYQQLFPKSVRHDLGEYYTPDWLAEHVLNELGYEGDPDKRLLDPACGSGTFLVMAINRIKKWFEANRERIPYDESDLCRKILANVIGFDLNPLAVMAARTNYLIAIRDLVGHVDKVEIPVYLCDSIMTPSTYGGLFAGAGGAKELKTAAATFHIPTEIATNRDDVAKYAEQLEFCVRNGYSPKEFLQRCRDESLPINAEAFHTELYDQLVALDKANKNGVWARIIKNAFAPLFVGRVDYVAGNPPWVNWNNLPSEYRQQLIKLNQDVYQLFPHRGVKARHGSASIDISTLFVYVGTDKYLKPRGRLGFVITQTVFKSSGGSEGFRRFSLPHGTPLSVRHVDDFSNLQVFEGAQNRTAVLIIERDARTNYPINYVQWEAVAEGTVRGSPVDEPLRPSIQATQLSAWPVQKDNQQSPWITVHARYASCLQKVLGASPYEAKLGVHTWLNGAFWLSRDEKLGKKLRLVTNAHDVGKIKLPLIEASVEEGLVYPLLRGRDIVRWTSEASLSIIVPHDPTRPSVGIPETTMRRSYPKAYAYLNRLRADLEGRSGYKKYIEPAGGPFYAVYNIGTYTFEPFRVVWKEQAASVQACVISKDSDGRHIIADHKLTLLGMSDQDKAHFVCALLNSSLVRAAVSAFAISVQISTHVCSHVALPEYDKADKLHKRIAGLGLRCHQAAGGGQLDILRQLERELDSAVATLWDVTEEELDELLAGLPREEVAVGESNDDD